MTSADKYKTAEMLCHNMTGCTLPAKLNLPRYILNINSLKNCKLKKKKKKVTVEGRDESFYDGGISI